MRRSVNRKLSRLKGIRCRNCQVAEPAIIPFLMHARLALIGVLANYRVLVIGYNIVKILLRDKTDGQADQKYKGKKFLYEWFFRQQGLFTPQK